jgi:hypothetical protein
MLKNIEESVTLKGESRIGENDTLVVEFSAHVPPNGVANAVQQNIREITMFEEHRREVRQDQAEFQQRVWEEEDEMNAEATE